MTWSYPPLRTYSFPTTSIELEKILTDFIKTQPNLKYWHTDTVGTDSARFGYRMVVCIKSGKSEYQYTIQYSNHETIWKRSTRSELKLLSVFDRNFRVTGYQSTDDEVEILADLFDETIMKHVRKAIGEHE